MESLKKLLVVLLTLGGMIVAMLTPIATLGFVAMCIWGTELMDRSLGADHPSTWFFFLVTVPAIAISWFFYLGLAILPVFAKYQIPIGHRRHWSWAIGRWMRARAIRYVELMSKYDRPHS